MTATAHASANRDVVVHSLNDFASLAVVGGEHTVVIDEPREFEGGGTAPNPFGLVLFLSGALDWKLVAPFYALLVLEHVSNEISRLLLPLRKPIESNLLMFIQIGRAHV